jgi:glycosyltransferase involved in cell wall biosynthesis
MTGENRFVFVAPAFNAGKTIQQMLMSIAGQSYTNWKIIVIDDMSTDYTEMYCNDFYYGMIKIGNSLDIDINYQFEFIENKEKKWEVANVLEGIKRCEDDDIICRIDGDDWLTDLDALAMIDASYKQTKCDALWTGHRWGFSDKNISGPMTYGSNIYQHPWVSSHLKTFRKHLLNDVKDENFRNEEGEYVRRAGDQAIYLPALHNSKNYVFMPRCVYHYTIDDQPATYQTPDALFQRDEALFLRKRGYVK